ncbi:serine protease FAM111A isoform X2 [Danio aesculapii]|uniref:serine protease FAM111A isoform X2 n=1 Tax=Danio aesculapii TaxID=1142201 RepID=UPI0024C08959|nr:serine protease FAM111A isoform X2 [Danio aesculapii]
MSEGPPNKKLKQTDLLSPKKETNTDSEDEETSQAGNTKKEKMAHSPKPEEKYSKHLQQRAEEQEHTFRFCFDSDPDPIVVECNTSMTVLAALEQKETFQNNKSIRDTKKVMVIERADGAAVKTDFPCSLIEKDETLKISFIKNEMKKKETQAILSLPRTDLVKFYIKATGKTSVMSIIKSNELRNKVDYACVYGLEEEKAEIALKRDGRFNEKIFHKLCLLALVSENKKGKQTRYEISSPVKLLRNKKFQIMAVDGKRPDCQKKPNTIKTENASDVDYEKYNPGQPTNSGEQGTIQVRETKSPGPPTTGQVTQNPSGDSGGLFNTEVEEFLQSSFENIMKKLKQRKNPQVQKFFQEDYDKGIQCFTEVNKVKQIMTLSDSVCLILVDNSPTGTGFLAFDRFILTNAHVIKDFVNRDTLKLSRPLEAVFNFEVVGPAAKVLSVKDDIVACGFEPDDRRRFYDFALLELVKTPDNCPELFKRYIHSPPPNRGGIYIVGHPGCGVKKMDPCLIIEPEKQLQSINKHISDNMSCPYVSLQCWPYLHQNRITYDTCMFHGSSGSPVFDERCNLIGMHSGGFHYKEQNKTDRSVIEYAYSMQSIVEGIVEQVRSRRRDILNLLSEFDSIKAQFKLEKTEDTSGAIMPIQEQEKYEKEEKMDVD